MTQCKTHEMKRYIATAIDPIHIGTGGYRMDRVDNSIIRDSDGIPKIPGSSLSGAIRSYTALNNSSNCGGNNSCENLDDPCIVCKIFGYTKAEKARKGLVSFYDARILLFPVATMVGPVWITTYANCQELLHLGIEDEFGEVMKNQFVPLDQITEPEADGKQNPKAEAKSELGEKINLGWIMLQKGDVSKSKNVSDQITRKISSGLRKNILSRTIIVHPTIFGQVVNDNLEVRTSVSINPMTGAAEDGALFTYEAIPRSTIFVFETVIANSKTYGVDISEEKVKEELKKGMNLLEPLGLGGMTTRGFGRLKVSELSSGGE